MKLILLQKITNLGNLGDTVEVKPGYGRNFLVPQGKAVPATAGNLAAFEAKRAEYEAKAKDQHDAASVRLSKIEAEDFTVSLKANASSEGKLYGSITNRDIAEALSAQSGVEFNKSEVVMGEGPIRHVGEYEVVVHLLADVETTVKVVIEQEAVAV
ncbi:50S ribosomal protein L9 [Luteimonas abyssi]|jgi:large subunit ribosomal protein L9|uniref:50S ribosomal protein L9 n=1 Tax=Luteimonas abyssi TaxID=1247514 RepID=UPI000737C0F1|nr:50S ribosomal protein L9 [Luteimonas abyssi]